jgi:hypothetical protein
MMAAAADTAPSPHASPSFTTLVSLLLLLLLGASWSATKPHAYVLFEWDTYLASMIATITDPWVVRRHNIIPTLTPATSLSLSLSLARARSFALAKQDRRPTHAAATAPLIGAWHVTLSSQAANNIIRMTKALHFRGYVPGFWNGVCGEVDKSKPPVGGLALQWFLEHHPAQSWVAELLLEQYLLWNRWWAAARQFDAVGHTKNRTTGLIAPGSTRVAELLPLQCQGMPDVRNRVDVVSGESGLDNSPLYDLAAYLESEDAIDTVDVGLSAIHARDSLSLANISRASGRLDFATELDARGASTVEQLNAVMWHEELGSYVNKVWGNNTWTPLDPKTGVLVLAPTTFYPMLSRAPSDAQVERMISRFLANSACTQTPCIVRRTHGRRLRVPRLTAYMCYAYVCAGSEFAVNSETRFGMPSVSRSSSSATDNN